ncbi:hypothetical protein OG21DRAFT_1446308 [Imleria badia]|nr:hypothetical protein OG21DRAFT_1446308 [Imleria badia]
MHKTQHYFSQCLEAASKSPMNYSLGAILVKGGKIISAGHNHHRTHYDGNHVRTQGHRKPVSMHAEMHAIFSITGMSPSFKQQVHAGRRGTTGKKPRSACFGVSGVFAGRKQKGAGAKKKLACACAQGGRTALSRPERGWDARRRDPRVNGADLYVVRVSKAGMGASKPCWRCVRWCAWSGVKRIFHWDPVLGRFEVLKVNGAEGEDVYETSSDARLFAGASY